MPNRRLPRSERNLWAKLKPEARRMRHRSTGAEAVLWAELRDRKLNGARFRRQHAIERFIVDFYCLEAKLVIEVDGPIHLQQTEEDTVRQAFLEALGLRVLRFTNDQVLQNIEEVLAKINLVLTERE